GTHPGRGMTCGSRNSRRARRWRASDVPLLLLPGGHDELHLLAVVFHLGDGRALAEQRPGRADLHALAAGGAGRRVAPRLVQVDDDAGVNAPPGDVPGVRPLDLVADAHAAGAEHAAGGVQAERRVRDVHRVVGVEVVQAHVIDAEVAGQILELAV